MTKTKKVHKININTIASILKRRKTRGGQIERGRERERADAINNQYGSFHMQL
jgi:hypothetical protein